MDQSEDTSWLILAGQAFGILLEMWKITKTVNVRIVPSRNIIGYKIAFEDKHVLSQTEADTNEYDRIAFVIPDISRANPDIHVLGRHSIVAFLRCLFSALSRT